jgi:hypothetical protein
VGGALERAEVPGPLAVVQDHLLVEVGELAHEKIFLAAWRACTRASTSAWVL